MKGYKMKVERILNFVQLFGSPNASRDNFVCSNYNITGQVISNLVNFIMGKNSELHYTKKTILCSISGINCVHLCSVIKLRHEINIRNVL